MGWDAGGEQGERRLSEDFLIDVEQPDLIDVGQSWEDSWKGMPDYRHEDLMPKSSMIVHFRNDRDRLEFQRVIDQRFSPQTKSIWFPKAEIGVAADKVWVSPLELAPRYPIYIISKGRADTRLTSRALEWLKVPYHIVIEPQEYDAYAAGIDPKKILTLPFSNLGLGGIPARNWVWEHSISIGAERHWILDDNISGFCRFYDNMKIEFATPAPFCIVEDFVDRYENLVMSGFNYDYFAPRKAGAKINPVTWNTRVYSGILLRNDITNVAGEPIRWRGRYNEDTDLSLRILKDGLTPSTPGRYATALFNALLMYKKPTLTMKGGNATELYQGAEAAQAEWEAHAAGCEACRRCLDGYGGRDHPCEAGAKMLESDGRWRMAESLFQQHPDVTTVERKWRRWQHQVDYRAYANNPAVLKTEGAPPERDWQLSLVQKPPGWGEMRGAYMQRAQEAPTATPIVVAPKPEKAPKERPTPAPPPVGQPLVSALDFVARMAAAAPVIAEPVKAEPAPAVPAPAPRGPELTPAQAEQPFPEPANAEGQAAPGAPLSAAEIAVDPEGFRNVLAARGHHLLTRDGKFLVSNASQLTDDERAYIKTNRDALIALAVPWAEPSPEPPPYVEPLQSSHEPIVFVDAGAPAKISLAQFLGTAPPPREGAWKLEPPPSLDGIDTIVLNFATTGLNWWNEDRPVGVTVGTLDGKLLRFLPFGFRGDRNLSEDAVRNYLRTEVRGKKIVNSKMKFDIHHAREWGVDFESQGCTFGDVQLDAALLDDHRKRFSLDILAKDYLGGEEVGRVDESMHADYAAVDVADRELYTAALVGRLRAVFDPLIEKEELGAVRALEDAVIPVVVEMEKNGSPLDEELMHAMHAECQREYGRLMLEVSREAGFAYDGTNSAKARLFEKCGLPPTDSYKEAVMEQIDHPLIQKAFRASQFASLDSKTFAAYPKAIRNGVLYYDINQVAGEDGGTRSGRFSIGLVQQVPNHGNHHAVFGFPVDLLDALEQEAHMKACSGKCRLFPRRLFIAGEGDYLESDAMQIEYRILAHLSNNANVLEAYRQNPLMSFHKNMWEMLKRYKADMLYEHTKSFDFAKQYGARSVKLAVMMDFITEAEGEEIRRAKDWKNPKLKQIHEIEAAFKKAMPEGDLLLDRASHLAKPECDDYCKQNDTFHQQGLAHRGWVKTTLGRRSRFPNNYKTYIALNRVIQGTAADVMKQKLVELHRERSWTQFLLRLTVHDSVSGDARTSETLARVKEVLNRQSFAFKVPILWDVNTAGNWAECK